jgi:hypothetical protein
VERAAVADGSRFREVQRELRGSKPESRGTEIEVASDSEQKRNDIAGDVGNTSHVRTDKKKHQREAAIKATQMDEHFISIISPPPPRGFCSGVLFRLAVYKTPPQQKKKEPGQDSVVGRSGGFASDPGGFGY